MCQSSGDDCVALNNVDCLMSLGCAEHGLCSARELRCVAGRHEDCRQSRACLVDGECWVLGSEQKCGEGTDRYDSNMRTGGIVLMVIGSAAVVVGVLVAVVGGYGVVGTGGAAEPYVEAGAGLAGGGGLTVLAIGLPLMLVGSRAVPPMRSVLAPRLRVGAGTASLSWSF